MANSIGKNVVLTLFGESHGPAIGFVLDGISPGIKIDYELIDKALCERRPNDIETLRVEPDKYTIISGVNDGYTTGEAICVTIPNENIDDSAYDSLLARPSHADYTSYIKSGGNASLKGGGMFSGRLTCAIVIAGSICKMALSKLNIKVVSHILQIGEVYDSSFVNPAIEASFLEQRDFKVISDVEEEMINEIIKAKEFNDSIGGAIQTAILNLPVGIGEPLFESLESEISKAIFSIGGIKGIEFGLGFGFASSHGSEVNDQFVINDGKVETLTNNNGGINGGLSNGMPVIFNTAIKPTPSIGIKQNCLDLENNVVLEKEITGRFDPCIVRRVLPVINAMTSIVLCDMLARNEAKKVFED